MNRIIKFRGLCAISNEWVYGGITSASHHHEGKTQIVASEFYEGKEEDAVLAFYDVIPETVGQFTGMIDINKKEVFGGDKIKYQHSENSKQYIGDVYYNQSCGAFFISTGDDSGFALLGQQKIIEVIGSIHTTPELIK